MTGSGLLSAWLIHTHRLLWCVNTPLLPSPSNLSHRRIAIPLSISDERMLDAQGGQRDDTPLPPCMPISKVTNGIILSLA